MYKDKKITVFMVCHNDEKSIERVIKTIPPFVDEVFVIDNGSTDKTSEKAQTSGAVIMKNKSRMGYGSSYIKGLPLVDGDIIITTDGDGAYPVGEAKKILDYFFDNNLDFLSCARFPLKDKYSICIRSKIGNQFLTSIMNYLFGFRLKDGQSQMFVFKKDILPLMKLKSKGIEFSNEIKIEAFINKNIKTSEYHIDYAERIGTSRLYSVLDGVEILFLMLKKKIFN